VGGRERVGGREGGGKGVGRMEGGGDGGEGVDRVGVGWKTR
jgi:hypothetical protein